MFIVSSDFHLGTKILIVSKQRNFLAVFIQPFQEPSLGGNCSNLWPLYKILVVFRVISTGKEVPCDIVHR